MKKVLLLGDSIRMGYEPFAREALANEAEVFAPADNCRFAKFALWEWAAWNGLCPQPDVIHWNNGIWDVFRLYDGSRAFTPVDEYVRDMRLLYSRLKLTGAKIVFATTTPALDGCAVVRNCDVNQYNAAATEALSRDGAIIHDLNAAVARDLENYIDSGDGFHLSEAGYRAAGHAVAGFVRGCF